THTGDDARCRRLSFVLVVRDQEADFQEHRLRIEQAADPLARRQFAGLVLAFDAGRAAAFAQTGLELRELLHHEAQMRLARDVHGYFSFEKSVGSMNTESTFCTILPFASESAETFFHSGSLRNSSQFLVACSRLACEMM